jgi:hypothetical protein
MKRHASAYWEGGLKNGKGTFSRLNVDITLDATLK